MDFRGTEEERYDRTPLLQGDHLGCLGKARPRKNVSNKWPLGKCFDQVTKLMRAKIVSKRG